LLERGRTGAKVAEAIAKALQVLVRLPVRFTNRPTGQLEFVQIVQNDFYRVFEVKARVGWVYFREGRVLHCFFAEFFPPFFPGQAWPVALRAVSFLENDLIVFSDRSSEFVQWERFVCSGGQVGMVDASVERRGARVESGGELDVLGKPAVLAKAGRRFAAGQRVIDQAVV
jgi:hypothetical protein